MARKTCPSELVCRGDERSALGRCHGCGEACSVAVDEVDMRCPADAALVDPRCEIELIGLTSREFTDPVGVITRADLPSSADTSRKKSPEEAGVKSG